VTQLSAENQFSYLALLGFPILVYIAGRLLERAVLHVARKVSGDIIFEQNISGDTGLLVIRTRNDVYFDEMTIHLKEREIDLLEMVTPQKRVEFTTLDKIKIECVLQPTGDRKLFVHSYIGGQRQVSEESLDSESRSIKDFMTGTDVSIETPRRTYQRKLYKDP